MYVSGVSIGMAIIQIQVLKRTRRVHHRVITVWLEAAAGTIAQVVVVYLIGIIVHQGASVS